MGSLWGATSPVTCHSHTIYADIHLEAGSAMPIEPEADERGLHVAEGQASLDGLSLDSGTLYVLRPGVSVTLRSQRGGQVMLCGGAPLDGARHVFWNFVSSSRERIEQAKEVNRLHQFVDGDGAARVGVEGGALQPGPKATILLGSPSSWADYV